MFADKIKQLRISQGLNQSEFAQRLNITPGAVSQWENGRTVPDTERLMSIAKEFSIPLDYFSDGEKQYTETELIRQHLLIELGAAQPKTDEAKFVSIAMDKMPKKEREKAVKILQAVYSEYFTEDKIG